MKKYLYIAIAAATLASCSQDEVMEMNQEAIAFGNPYIGNSTRAADKTYSGETALTKFNVYGTVKGAGVSTAVAIYNGNEVTGTVGANSVWTCEANKQYWISGADYDFAAVVDADNVEVTNGMPSKLTYTTTATGSKDLLYAENLTPTVGEKVAFEFNHLLSKVWFTAKSNTADGYYYSINNINIANFQDGTYYIKATDTKAAGTWEGGVSSNISFGNIEEVTNDSGAKTNTTQMLLIPNTSTFNITFTVNLYFKKDATSTAQLVETKNYTSPVEIDLQKGHSYNFNFDLTIGSEIKFTVANNPTWTNGNTTDGDDDDTVFDHIPVTLQ